MFRGIRANRHPDAPPHGGSLLKRLSLGLGLLTGVVLLAGTAALSALFTGIVDDGFEAQLNLFLESLIAVTESGPDGLTQTRSLADPRFDRVYSGWYWQVTGPTGEQILTSRSLFGLSLPPGPDGTAMLTGPRGEALMVARRAIALPGADRPVLFMVAGDLREVDGQIERFERIIFRIALLVFIVIVLTLGLIRLLLRPLNRIRDTLAAIRDGRADRLDGVFPLEVAPLAQEVNALLDHSQTVVERARTHVGNLAHGLKTPMAILANEAAGRQDRLARQVRQQTELMQRQISHYLARARTAATGNLATARTTVQPVVHGLVRALRHIHDRPGLLQDGPQDGPQGAGGTLTIDHDCEAGLVFRGERQDLEEIVGNLLDNACKWARSRVLLLARREGRQLIVEIHDDGPGLPETDRAAAMRRGVRLDETVPGSGLGLSITRDIVGLYAGSLSLRRSGRLGGLCPVVTLPAASPATGDAKTKPEMNDGFRQGSDGIPQSVTGNSEQV